MDEEIVNGVYWVRWADLIVIKGDCRRLDATKKVSFQVQLPRNFRSFYRDFFAQNTVLKIDTCSRIWIYQVCKRSP